MQDKKTQEFIVKAIHKHAGKYNYLQTFYVNAKTKVTVACPIHGNFRITPNNHLNGQGCRKCGCNKITTVAFIEQARKVHKSRYNYEHSIYKGSGIKVEIICSRHGSFWQSPSMHTRGVFDTAYRPY